MKCLDDNLMFMTIKGAEIKFHRRPQFGCMCVAGCHAYWLHMYSSAFPPGGPVRGERANLKGLVNGCIEAKFCKQICVGKLSPRSTQCNPLHRSRSRGIRLGSLISIFSSKIAKTFSRLNKWISDFFNFLVEFCIFSANF